jgi:hypothetical protein
MKVNMEVLRLSQQQLKALVFLRHFVVRHIYKELIRLWLILRDYVIRQIVLELQLVVRESIARRTQKSVDIAKSTVKHIAGVAEAH